MDFTEITVLIVDDEKNTRDGLRMSFEDELTAFEAYAEAMPNNCVFLVDTYDTIDWLIENVKNHNGRIGIRRICDSNRITRNLLPITKSIRECCCAQSSNWRFT